MTNRRLAVAVALLLHASAVLAAQRGPLWILGRTPDKNPYGCTASTSGTYVGPSASITDSLCAVWTLGTGASPNTIILRNGAQAGGGTGVKIEYYLGVVYVLGSDSTTWYSWSDAISAYQTFGTNDPSMSMVPTGYFVAKTGNDSNTCVQAKNTSTPRLTVNAGIACLGAGDTLFVRVGNYAENIISVPNGTSWSNKVRIANYPGESAWLIPTVADAGQHVIWLDCACHYVEFDGINIDGRPSGQNDLWTSTNNGNDPHHIRIQNAEIIAGTQALASGAIGLGSHTTIGATGFNEVINMTIHGGGATGLCGFACASYGVYVKGPNNLIDHCDIYDTSGAGIQIYNASGDPAVGNVVRNTKIHDITRTGSLDEVWGIVVVGSNSLIFNNLIYGINVGNVNPGNAGIAVALTGNRVYNNTIYGNTNSGIRVDSTSISAVIQNNIAYLNTGANYSDGGGTSTTHNNELEGINPVFVSAGTDFHLQTSSPAKDVGLSLASFFTTDLEAIPRPQGPAWDIGAYEFH